MGYDAAKKVKGRKIHALVDTEGLPLASSSIPPLSRTATAQRWSSTRYAAAFLARAGLGRHRLQRPSSRSRRRKIPGLPLEIVKRSDDMKGFVVLPRRWVVERTFSWFGRNRRLAKDLRTLPIPSPPS